MTFLPTPTGEYTHNRAEKAVRIERKGAFYEALFVFGGAATVLAGFARGRRDYDVLFLVRWKSGRASILKRYCLGVMPVRFRNDLLKAETESKQSISAVSVKETPLRISFLASSIFKRKYVS